MVKNPPANAEDLDLIPGLGRSPRVGNGNPLQYFCQDNPLGRGAWQATVHGVTKNQTQLSDEHTHTYLYSLVVRNLPGMQVIQVQSLSWEDSLEEEMATHSSIFARRIPWTEKPDGLQSVGSQRVSMTEVT